MDLLTLLQVLDSSIRFATPLLLACLAGLFSERAGIFDIGLEGKMLAAALMAAAVAAVSGNVWIGLLAGIGASLFLSAIHGIASITFRGNQLISGVAINFLAAGLTVLIAQSWFAQGGRTPSLEGAARFNPITLPFADALRDVPVIGPIYYEVISGHSIMVYVAMLMVPLSWWVLFRTRFGLRLRAVGENPAAVDTAGVSVVRLRFAAVAICGVLCGLAGAYLATGLQAGFVKDMTAGRGYIALAALIFAKWRPWYALYACLLFGFLQALALRPDLVEGAIGVKVQGQLLDALPYILTVIILAGFVGKAIPPRAGGEPYVKERSTRRPDPVARRGGTGAAGADSWLRSGSSGKCGGRGRHPLCRPARFSACRGLGAQPQSGDRQSRRGARRRLWRAGALLRGWQSGRHAPATRSAESLGGRLRHCHQCGRVDAARHADRLHHVPERSHQFFRSEPPDRRAVGCAFCADEGCP